jgi:hypothetical protein
MLHLVIFCPFDVTRPECPFKGPANELELKQTKAQQRDAQFANLMRSPRASRRDVAD